MININYKTEELQEKLNGLVGILNPRQMGRDIALGINLTLRQARTQSDREIRKVYNVRQQFVLRYIKVSNAKNGNWIGTVSFPTTAISMSQWMNTRQVPGGVAVEILRGKSEIIKGAFLFVSKFSSNLQSTPFTVMHRSNSSGGKSYAGNFQFRHQRISPRGSDLPIGAMFSPSPFSSVFNPIVERNIKIYTEGKLMENIFTLLDKDVKGYIREANNRGGYKR